MTIPEDNYQPSKCLIEFNFFSKHNYIVYKLYIWPYRYIFKSV